MEESGQLHTLDTLTLERTPLPIEKEGGWAPERGWTFLEKRKSFTFSEIHPLTVQPIASSYTVPIIVTIVFLCYSPMRSNKHQST